MKYSKQELIELSKPYFESKPMLPIMYATSDNQFFYPESKSYAEAHARCNEVELFLITRLETIKPPKQEEIKKEIEQPIVVEEVVKPKEEIKKTRKK